MMDNNQVFEKSDEQLIKKALGGNKRAWMNLLKRYESQVYNYGIRMTSNKDDASDLMQEVFISVFRNLSNYRGEGSFRGWLFKIAHYRCIEFYRRKKPNQSFDDSPEIEDITVSTEEQYCASQQSQQIVSAMQHLPFTQKAVVELKFFGQFTFDEIADQLGISVNTAKSRLYSALAKLKILLEVEYV